MREVRGTKAKSRRFARFAPERVLYDFDGPRIFTVRAARQLHLACFSDEDELQMRFVVVPCDDLLIEKLETGSLAVRTALEQAPEAWLVDWGHDGTLRATRKIRLTDVPPDALPRPGTLLLPTMVPPLDE